MTETPPRNVVPHQLGQLRHGVHEHKVEEQL